MPKSKELYKKFVIQLNNNNRDLKQQTTKKIEAKLLVYVCLMVVYDLSLFANIRQMSKKKKQYFVFCVLFSPKRRRSNELIFGTRITSSALYFGSMQWIWLIYICARHFNNTNEMNEIGGGNSNKQRRSPTDGWMDG